MKILIKNTKAVIKENGVFTVKDTDICTDDGVILSVGSAPDGFSPDETIDGKNRLAIAGLINCHTHTYMSLYRNFADDLSFGDWLFKNIEPLEDKTTSEDAYYGSLLACAEMIRTGTTCFTDMHMFKFQTARAADESGMRAVISRGLAGDDEQGGGERRLNEAFEEIERYSENDRLSFMLAPHAIYSCDTAYLERIISLARERVLPLNTHLSETRYEVSLSLEKYGKTPTEYLDSLGFFDIKTLAAHCVHLTDNDIKILADKGVSVAANPMSNLKLGNGFAPIPKLMENGVNICLGTDSAASNNSLNLFSDMSFTALIHKGVTEDAQCVSAQDVYSFATQNGAKALGLDTGRLEAGAKADIALLDLNVPQFNPQSNLVAALSYSANGSEVTDVIIDGKVVMRNKELLTIDEERVFFETNKIIKRIG